MYKNIHNSIWKVKNDHQYISVNNILMIKFCLAADDNKLQCVIMTHRARYTD